MTATARHSAFHRRLAIGGVALPVALVGSLLCATAADAAPLTYSTKASLRSAMASATNGSVFTLGADLTGDGGVDDVLTVPNNRVVTVDLADHELDLDSIVVGTNATLYLGTTSSGRLVVGDGDSLPVASGGTRGVQLRSNAFLDVQRGVRLTALGSAGRAGIGTAAGDDTSAVLYVDGGAMIEATGGSRGAGIGGGEAARPLSVVSIGDATVTARGGTGAAGIGGGYANPSNGTVEIASASSGTITATGGSGAAGIGGGQADSTTGGGIGADVTITDADVTVADGGPTTGSTATAPSAIGGGQGTAASASGTLTNTASGTTGTRDALRVASGANLIVPSGRSVTNAGNLLVSGTLSGAGSIDNTGGTIKKESGGTIDDANLTVTGRNHAVALDAGAGTTSAPATVHVYATSFANAGLDLGAYTGTSGTRRLVGWTGPRYAGASSPTTTRMTNAALLTEYSTAATETAPVALTAVYEAPIAFTGTTMPNAATGQAYDRPTPVSGDATSFTIAGDPASGLPSGTIPTLPVGLTWNPTTGAISGRATNPGHYSFVITASSVYQSVSQVVTMDVAGAPVLGTTALPAAAVGTAYRTALAATSDSAVTFRLVSGVLPAGLSLDAATGVISGTPTAAGTYSIGLEATNAFGAVQSTLSLAVVAAVSVGTPAGQGGTGAGTTTTPGAASPATTPVLPAVGTTTVKLGHPLSLSLAASSTTAVTYSVPAKELPKGVTLDTAKGLLYGAPREAGRFVLHVSAKNAVGTSTVAYTIVVPEATSLISASPASTTPVAGKPVKVALRGLLKGEHWRIQVDGKTVEKGVAKKAGTLQRSVKIASTAKDRWHVIRISGDRRIADPSTVASHEVTVTVVARTKALRVHRSGTSLDVRGLAAHERVVIRRGGVLVAKGHADKHGIFVTDTKALKKGTYTATGAAKGRAGQLRIK